MKQPIKSRTYPVAGRGRSPAEGDWGLVNEGRRRVQLSQLEQGKEPKGAWRVGMPGADGNTPSLAAWVGIRNLS